MGKVSKYIPENEMVDKQECCKIIRRCPRTFDLLKSQLKITPCAKDGKRLLYRRSDVEKLKKEMILYF